MPIYEYECTECGPFTAMQPMARFLDPCACPGCGIDVARKSLSAPAIGIINLGGRIGHGAARSSAASPHQASTPHPAGCGCCMRRVPLARSLSTDGRVFTSHGPVKHRPGRPKGK